jgi:hypothetical protein
LGDRAFVGNAVEIGSEYSSEIWYFRLDSQPLGERAEAGRVALPRH